jgi:hypothetical protein
MYTFNLKRRKRNIKNLVESYNKLMANNPIVESKEEQSVWTLDVDFLQVQNECIKSNLT